MKLIKEVTEEIAYRLTKGTNNTAKIIYPSGGLFSFNKYSMEITIPLADTLKHSMFKQTEEPQVEQKPE